MFLLVTFSDQFLLPLKGNCFRIIMSYKEANDVLNYWFGGGDPAKRPRWCGGGEEAAQEIRNKFGALVGNSGDEKEL